MSTKDLAKDLEETVDQGGFIEFDASGNRKDQGGLDGYEVLQKVKLDDPSVMQVVFRYKNRKSV